MTEFHMIVSSILLLSLVVGAVILALYLRIRGLEKLCYELIDAENTRRERNDRRFSALSQAYKGIYSALQTGTPGDAYRR